MRIEFMRHSADRYSFVASERTGADVRLDATNTIGFPPHDLVHFAVEAALQLEGFWHALDLGATFKGLAFVEPSRHRVAGTKTMRKIGDAVMEAESKVICAYRVWREVPDGRAVSGPPPPLSEAELAVATAAIQAVAAEWAALPDGASLVKHWPVRR